MGNDLSLAALVITFVEHGESIGWAGPLLVDEDIRREVYGIPSVSTDRRRNVYYVIVFPDGETLCAPDDGPVLYRREAQFGTRAQAEEYLETLRESRPHYSLAATVERVEQAETLP